MMRTVKRAVRDSHGAPPDPFTDTGGPGVDRGVGVTGAHNSCGSVTL